MPPCVEVVFDRFRRPRRPSPVPSLSADLVPSLLEGDTVRVCRSQRKGRVAGNHARTRQESAIGGIVA